MLGSDRYEFFPACRLGAYEIVKVLGRGGMATVYEARHVLSGRRAAVKVLRPDLARDGVAAARLLREGRAVARVRHPHVVDLLDMGDHDGVPFLVMELLEGEDLGQYIRRKHPAPLPEIADCLLQIVSAVEAIHAAGIAHRDLKPSNIRLTSDRRGALVSKLCDFGIAKVGGPEPEPELTETNEIVGTVSYMAPEQVRSAKTADAASDVYALGVILYECTTGKRPFGGESSYERMHAVLTETLVPPGALRPDLPAAFDALVLRAMKREPSERFASARELGRALTPFASDPSRWWSEFDAAPADAESSPQSPETGGHVTLTLSNIPPAPRGGYRLNLAACGLALVVGAVLAHALSSARRAAPSAGTEILELQPAPIAHPAPLVLGPARAFSVVPNLASTSPPSPAPPLEAPLTAREATAGRRESSPLPASRTARVTVRSDAPSSTPLSFGTNGAPIVP